MLSADALPSIADVDDTIFKKAIVCKATGRAFRLVKQELDYLKKLQFPLPIYHNEYRVQQLMDERPTLDLYVTKSDLS
jgi:hypothetical protein